MFDMHGQCALVTGSSSGVGLACVTALARQGARVMVNGRSPDKVHAAVEGLRAQGLDAVAAVFDVSDIQAASAAIETVSQTVGPIDILFANAAMQHRQSLLEFDLLAFQQVVHTNLTAQWALGRQVAAAMVRRQYGRIVFTGSITAMLGRRDITAYTAAKGALHALVRQWSSELAPHGVTVNGLAPGYIRTELTSALTNDPQFDAWLCDRTPAGRWGTTQDLESAMVFLAARESGFVTGQILAVDGGLSTTM